MIKNLILSDFTVFWEGTRFDFSPWINVIIGENGMWKSHVLKLAYSLVEVARKRDGNKYDFEKQIADKLRGVFRPDDLGRLTARRQGRTWSSVEIGFINKQEDFSFRFASNSKTKVNVSEVPNEKITIDPVFFPTHEVLSIYQGFTSLYENREISFDETYYDLCKLLDANILRWKRSAQISTIIETIETELNGNIIIENGKFYLKSYGSGKMEAPLMAEGLRKIGVIAYLLTTGKLTEKGIIFWDEPEANLNPRLIKSVAALLVKLAECGIQVILGTHSLFLLKELHYNLWWTRNSIQKKYFWLYRWSEWETLVESGNSLEQIEHITALDEDIAQAERIFDTRAYE